MKSPLLLTALLAATLTAGAAQQPISFLGNAAPAQAKPDRVIVLTDATRYINVTGGQTVRFVAGDRSFAWTFENGSAHLAPFDLERIVPKDVLHHRVTAYVADNPLYANN